MNWLGLQGHILRWTKLKLILILLNADRMRREEGCGNVNRRRPNTYSPSQQFKKDSGTLQIFNYSCIKSYVSRTQDRRGAVRNAGKESQGKWTQVKVKRNQEKGTGSKWQLRRECRWEFNGYGCTVMSISTNEILTQQEVDHESKNKLVFIEV